MSIREEICNIISEMLDNPDKSGIYGTTKCFDALEKLIEEEVEKVKCNFPKCTSVREACDILIEKNTKELKIKDLEELGRRLPSVAYAEGYDIEKIIDSKIKSIKEGV